LTPVKSRVIIVRIDNGKTVATLGIGRNHGVDIDWSVVFVRGTHVTETLPISRLQATTLEVISASTPDNLKANAFVFLVPPAWRGGSVEAALSQFIEEEQQEEQQHQDGFTY